MLPQYSIWRRTQVLSQTDRRHPTTPSLTSNSICPPGTPDALASAASTRSLRLRRADLCLKLRRNAAVSGGRGERKDGALDHPFGERHLVGVLREGHRSCHGSLANPTG